MSNSLRMISASELKMYLECPQEWRARYVEHFTKPEKVSGNLAMGSNIHSVLEQLHDPEDPASLEDVIGSLKDEYSAALQALESGNVAGDAKELTKENKQTIAMIEGYPDWAASEDAAEYRNVAETLSVEQELRVEVPELGVVIVGRADRILRMKSGAIVPEDYKSCQAFSRVEPLIHLDWQFKLYPYLLGEMLPDEYVPGTLVTMLRKVGRSKAAKPPFYKQRLIRYRDHERVAFDAQLRGTIRSLLRDEEALHQATTSEQRAGIAPATGWVSGNCTWKCDYFRVCAQMQTGMDVSDQFDIRAPYQGRYETEEDDA